LKKIILTSTIVFVALFSQAQQTDAEALIQRMADKLNTIESYSATAAMELDVDFIEMPVKYADIHYLAPDSFRIDGDGFLMIPKVGLKPITEQLDLSSYRAIEKGMESLNGSKHLVVDMLPLDRGGQVVLTTLWIDTQKELISRIETFTKRSGSYDVDLDYDGEILPSTITVSFEVEGLNIPVQYFGGDADMEDSKIQSDEVSQGKVTVKLEDYRIEYIGG